MAVKIKLKRIGKMREPHYRIVIADARTKRGGRAIEEIGQYHPIHDPSVILLDSERAQYWLGVGAQPTEAVTAILKVTGDWQKFKGEPAPEPMKVAAPKADKRLAYEAALKNKDADGSAAEKPAKPAKKAAPKPKKDAEEAPAAEAPAQTAPETAAEETPVADAPVADAPAEESQAAEATAEDSPAESTPEASS